MRTRHPAPVPGAALPAFCCFFFAICFGGCAGKAAAQPAPLPVDPRTPPAADPREPAPPAAELPEPPPPAGVYHVLEPGQTLYGLFRAYGVPVPTLMEVNGITDPTGIPVGTPIFVPGASQALPVPGPGPALLAWPLEGSVTSAFGTRGQRGRHYGIDIDGVMGQVVYAAAAGTVIRAGTEGRYGRTVVLDHGSGLMTLYAHASRLLVQEGEQVGQGEPIALVGKSGNARGTHLHFEARRDGQLVDPRPLLPGGSTTTAAAHH